MWDCCGTYIIAFVIMVVVMVIMGIKQSAQNKADKAENKSASSDYVYARNEKADIIGGTNLDRFFIECVLSGCNDFTKEKNVARARLLAEKYNLVDADGIEALYLKGLKAHESISGRIEDDKLTKKREEEKVAYARLNRYANLYGKEKKIAMLTDRMRELREKANSLDKGAEMLMRSTQQQERDWATWGGIASGIAGAGAGVATALDIQAQNAQIRAQNAENMRAAMPAYMSVTGSASQNRTNADAIQKQIALIQEKLISDIPADKVMTLLDILNSTVDVSETGAFEVTATIKAKSKLFIFDDVVAVADGTIIAHVYDGNVEIGTAMMVIPVDGVVDKVGVVGMGLSGAELGKTYKVSFTPHKLWLMEK